MTDGPKKDGLKLLRNMAIAIAIAIVWAALEIALLGDGLIPNG